MPTLFDPLRHLQVDLFALPELGPKGIILRFDRQVMPETRRKALEVIKNHEWLLVLQLENKGASVQKLLAHGKVSLKQLKESYPKSEK